MTLYGGYLADIRRLNNNKRSEIGQDFHPAIPLNAGQVKGWKHLPFREPTHTDPLVPLGPLSQEAPTVATSSLYFGEHNNSPYADQENRIEGGLLTLFVRRSVARRLSAAEQMLPFGHHLLVFDAYRPHQVQGSLYTFYKQKLEEKYPHLSDEELGVYAQNYVSLPSADPLHPFPHGTGGAVDLGIVAIEDHTQEEELLRIRSRLAHTDIDIATRISLEMRSSAIMRRHAKLLHFGTALDHGGEASTLTHYESRMAAGETLTDEELIACISRRLLFNTMTRVGLQSYFAEWWHFNAPESQMGAVTAGLDHATFRAISLDQNNMSHENERIKMYEEINELQEKMRDTLRVVIAKTAIQAEIISTLFETGDPRAADDWPAEIIAPPEENTPLSA